MANTRQAGYSNSKNYQRKLYLANKENLNERLTELEEKVAQLLSQTSTDN